MIQSFADRETMLLFKTSKSRKWAGIQRTALRKLDQLDSAKQIDDLLAPPGNRLEALHADRSGQHSIRINDQYRICFIWREESAHEVEIVDYH